MDLLDRYLATIRHNLPPSRAADITEELRGELLDRIEAKEAALGREFDEAGVSALIKDYGPPLVVAGRYREHQYLIGPQAYPYYQYGLRVSAVIAVAVFLFSAVVPALMANGDPLKALLHGLHNVWIALLICFALVTLFFAVGERTGAVAKHIAAWNPAHLPSYEKRQRGAWESPFEVGLGILFLLVWTGIVPIPIPVGHEGRGVQLTPAPVWSTYYWPVLVLSVATLVNNLVCWLRPNWASVRLVLGLGTQLGWIFAIASLRANGPWVVGTSTAQFTEQAERAQAGINTIIGMGLTIALIVSGIGLVLFVYQNFLRRLIMGR